MAFFVQISENEEQFKKRYFLMVEEAQENRTAEYKAAILIENAWRGFIKKKKK